MVLFTLHLALLNAGGSEKGKMMFEDYFIFSYKSIGRSAKKPDRKSNEDEKTLADLNSAHRRL